MKTEKTMLKLKISHASYEALGALGRDLGLSAQMVASKSILGLLSQSGEEIATIPRGIPKKSVWVRFDDKEILNILNSRYIINNREVPRGKNLGHMCARILTSALNGHLDMRYFKPDLRPFRERPRYSGWKIKPIALWGPPEFWGYYLDGYFKLMGEEDNTFASCSEKGTAWARKRIEKFNKMVVKGNEHLKEFMDWYFDFRRRQRAGEFTHWTEPVVSFNDLFGRGPFRKIFLSYKSGHNVYRSSSSSASEAKEYARRQNEYGSVAYWDKKKGKTISPRDVLWNFVSRIRMTDLKKEGVSNVRYLLEYDRKAGGHDWQKFDEMVPQDLLDGNHLEWACKVLTELRKK